MSAAMSFVGELEVSLEACNLHEDVRNSYVGRTRDTVVDTTLLALQDRFAESNAVKGIQTS